MSQNSGREQLVDDISDKMRRLRDLVEQTIKDVKVVNDLANQQQPTTSPQAVLGRATESFSSGPNFSGLAGTGISRSLEGVEGIISEAEHQKDDLDKLCSNEGLRRLSKVAFGDSDQWGEKNRSNPDNNLLAEDVLR